MIKKELLQMPKLKATAYMMRLVAEDKPVVTKSYGYTYTKYKRLGYTRCCVKNGIFKLAIFFSEAMRMGGTLPVYEIYFDREKKQYLTYDCRTEKWLTASIYRLNMPSYSYYAADRLWISRETNKAIRRYFNTDKDGIDAISQFQENILAERLEQRHKKETDPWDEDLLQTPALPKDWLNWVSKVGVPEHFMFYTYTRNKKNRVGYCSHCGKTVPIKEPRYNKEGICPRCRTAITYKAIGKCGTVVTDYRTAHLIQRCKDGIMLREFIVRRTHKRYKHENPEVYSHEVRRVICDKNGIPQRAYYYGLYKQVKHRWIATPIAGVGYYYYNRYEGKLYGKTMPTLIKNELKKTGIAEYYRYKGIIEPERFLITVGRYPYFEKIAKVGLTTLFDEQIRRTWSDDIQVDSSQSSLLKLLHITSEQLKRLQKCNGGYKLLRWLQYGNISGQIISDETINWMLENDFTPKEFAFISDKMTMEQIRSYIMKKMRKENMRLREVITTWSDYLSMAKRLKMDVNNESVYKVHRLRQKHNELVAICNKEELSLRAEEIRELYPCVEKVMAEIKDKYEFADRTYTVLAPVKVEDVLVEGKRLDHCVSNDKYWERIATSESYILFLRKTKEPDVAYYTLEVEPGGTIRQKRTMGDTQQDDIKDATEFLRKWQTEIAKRMSGQDRKLAAQSKILRLEEFAQMDRDNVLINTGHLHGHRLVDVLMADLMEVAA